MRSGELLSVTMPSWRTSSGRCGVGDRDAVLHLHLRDVEVGAELEGDGERHGAVVGGRGGHVEHVLDAVDLLLERRRHGVRDHLGIRARVGGAHDDGGRHDLRVLRHRQPEVGERARPA